MFLADYDVRVNFEFIMMRLDMYHRSSSPTAQYQPTGVNIDRALIRLETDLTNANTHITTVNFTILMHVIYLLVP